MIYAGFKVRLIAFAYDYLVILAYLAVLTAVSIVPAILSPHTISGLLFDSPLKSDFITFILLVLPVILYFTFGESSSQMATWGKRKAGLRVVNQNGGRITRPRAFIRSLVKFLPWQLAHTGLYHIPGWPLAPEAPPPFVLAAFAGVWLMVGAYIGTMLFTRTHRTPYDWLVNSFVVRLLPEDGSV